MKLKQNNSNNNTNKGVKILTCVAIKNKEPKKEDKFCTKGQLLHREHKNKEKRRKTKR